MTQDDIRKLLGGYATNALSADERRVLFEAALEDQELFNALQNEDALRELLADPLLRDQVRSALETPAIARRRPHFWSRRWVFGVAIPAMVAIILIVVMNWFNAPRLIAPAAEKVTTNIAPKGPIAPQEVAPKLEPVPPEAKKQLKATAPKRIAQSLTASRQASAPVAAPFNEALRPPVPQAARPPFAAGFSADGPLYQGPLVRYSVVRSGPAGDEVRIEVTTGIAGSLALYQVDAAGNSKRIYPGTNQPETDQAVLVLPGRTIQIPSSPIKMLDAGQRLRLVVLPAPAPMTIGSLGAVGGAAVRVEPPPSPLVVDIPLAP
jgi:hypothetical protein